MSIVVVGSISFDTIKTPFGQREMSLGGAANYFAMSGKFFSKIKMVGVVGDDFPPHHLAYLHNENVDITGIERLGGRSFHWQGEYGYDLGDAKTIKTELNVFEHFSPKLSPDFCEASTVFLANIDPDLQIHVLNQMQKPRIRALDSMNFWIKNKNSRLKTAISMVDILLINDAEIRSLSGEHNTIKAAKYAIKMGVKIVVIKRGEFGALLVTADEVAFVPAYPLEDVFDPTGAGDTFAGGFLGYLDGQPKLDINNLKKALLMGTVMSSFVIEKFSFDRMKELDQAAIRKRLEHLHCMVNLS